MNTLMTGLEAPELTEPVVEQLCDTSNPGLLMFSQTCSD